MIIWIPSYPKSGNTWVRAFISAYFYGQNGKFDFKLLDKIGEFPDHNMLGKFMDSKKFHHLAEVSKHWIKVQEEINLKKTNIFLKTHSAFCTINGNIFTNSNNSSAFIYIVRDPRNVVLSMSNHFGISQEESFQIISDERYIIYPQIDGQMIPSTLVGSWSNHCSSWKKSEIVNRIIIKYEDLIDNPKINFEKMVKFLNQHIKINYDEKKLINSISTTKFENFKKHEDEHGFNMGQKNKFFHLGKKTNWKTLLDPKISGRIVDKFKIEMEDLGYI